MKQVWRIITLSLFAAVSIGAQSVQPPPQVVSGKKITDAEIVKELELYLNKVVAEDQFSGAVLVARDGKPIFKKAFGLASKSAHTPNDVDTRFNLGSLNKSFTSVAIAQLAQQGKLAYTDTISKHLPDYTNKTAANKVTIHQLLTHTSGMGDYYNREFMARRASLKTLADFLPLFVNDPLSFAPGEKVQYSNAGYVVLGLIIERLSGQSYYDYVREHIFKPSGMTSTDSYERDQKVPNLATGYTNMGPDGPQPGPRRDNTSSLPGKGNSAGGGYSTIEDMLKFASALLTHKLLNPAQTEIVFGGHSPQRPEGPGKGYGFLLKQVNGMRIVGNGGGGPGINAMFRIYLDRGYTVVILSNYDPPSAERIAGRIDEMLVAP
jgi:CubicO group peptidase (beta-lactamase class C family)